MGAQADMLGSLRYGFSLYHAIKIEGIPHVFIERMPEGTLTATGYTFDASLMIDESARVGSKIDESTGIGRAFDLSFGLERSAVTASLFKKPTYIARLTDTLAHNETGAARVNSTTGFAASGAVYIGNERIEYAATSATQFQTLTRGTPGSTDWKGQAFNVDSPIATWVTDAPMFWRGRKVIMYAIAVDPFGRVVSSSMTDEVWRGHIKSEPRPYPGGWSFSCRPLDRKLDDPVCASFSGKATLQADPDAKAKINPSTGVWLTIGGAAYSSGLPSAAYWQPFSGLDAAESYTLSFLQGWLAIQWIAKVSADGVTTNFPASVPKFVPGGPYNQPDMKGKKGAANGKAWQNWQVKHMHVRAKVQNTGQPIKMSAVFNQIAMQGAQTPLWWGFADFDYQGDLAALGDLALGPIWSNPAATMLAGNITIDAVADTAYHWIPIPIMFFSGTQLGAMTITLDDDDPASVPASGFVVLENNDALFVVEYTDKVVNGNEIEIQVNNFKGSIADMLQQLGTGDTGSSTVSCKFCFVDNGQAVDTMRRLLYSSGRGNNDDGTFDTLPAGSGYDIEEVDDNFAVELDGGWSDLSADFLIDENVSFASIYGPLLALSQRAVVSRTTASGFKLTCVATSVAETAEYSFTLTDAHIVAGNSGGSVKATQNPNTPNRIETSLKRYKQDTGRIVVNDIVAQRADGLHQWAISINGFNRDEIAGPILGWARSLFAARAGRLIYDIECVPWIECQTGDAIRIESSHFNFWNRSTGARGYSGTGRVMGRAVNLKTGRITLSVAVSNAFPSYTLAPSAKLVSTNHTTNPALITVAGKYLALMQAYLAAEPSGFKLLVYNPGTDQTGDTVTVNAVTGSAASTIMVVSAHSLSTALVAGQTHLTVPFTATDSTVQALHMHTDTTGATWQ